MTLQPTIKRSTYLQIIKSILIFCLFFLMIFPGSRIYAVKSKPPLVPEGENILNIRELLPNITKSSILTDISFSPDGKIFAACSEQGIRLWDTFTGKELQRLEKGLYGIYSIDFSPDGRTIAVASHYGTAHLVDILTGAELREMKAYTGRAMHVYVREVQFSPDGKLLATASGHWHAPSSHAIQIWDVASGKEILLIKGHEDTISSLRFSPDGKTLFSSSADGTIRFWDVSTGKETGQIDEYDCCAGSIDLSPDGRKLASFKFDESISLWDVNTKEKILEIEGPEDFNGDLRFSPDGNSIAAGFRSGAVRLWDTHTGKEILHMHMEGQTERIESVRFSPDGKIIAAGSADGGVRFWDAVTGNEIRRMFSNLNSIYKVQFSPDGKFIAIGLGDDTARLWDAATGREIYRLKGHTGYVMDLCFTPDSKILASSSYDYTIRLWNVNTGKERRVIEGHTMAIKCIHISPDGKLLASGSDDNTVRLWNLETGQEIYCLKGHRYSLNEVHFSPDGNLLASASDDNTIRLWDVSTGKETRRIQVNGRHAMSIDFSPDGKTIACGTWDKTILIWDVATGKMIRSMIGHEDVISSIRFSPDGKYIASSTWGKVIHFRDVASGKEIHRIESQKKKFLEAYWSIGYSPDGKILASASGDGKVCLWDATPGSMGKQLWTYYCCRYGNWLSMDPQSHIHRGDDGSILVQKDPAGRITSVLPPPPFHRQKGKLILMQKPDSLETYEGKAAEFVLFFKNTGKGRIYHLNVSQDTTREPRNALTFHPPSTLLRLEPGESTEMPCKVSHLSTYKNTNSDTSTLYLKVTSDYGTPVLLEIPVRTYFFALQLLKWKLTGSSENEEIKDILKATVKCAGNQDMNLLTEFQMNIANRICAKSSRPHIKAGERCTLTFHLDLPLNWTGKQTEKELKLIAVNHNKPLYIRSFSTGSVILPRPSWYHYVLIGLLILIGLAVIVYIIRLARMH